MRDLLRALEHYLEAKHAHDEARNEYWDYSWDYYGASWRADMNNAANEFGQELAKFVDARIKESSKC